MEREALFRGLRKVIQDISVKEIVTDASASVRKMLGITIKCLICMVLYYAINSGKFPDIAHSMDIWHKSERLKKSLVEVRTL